MRKRRQVRWERIPISKRTLIYTIAVLLVLNALTIVVVVNPFSSEEQEVVVASVGEVAIERQQLWVELEERFGQEVLNDMIDDEVINQAAKKYQISVSEEELETELAFIKARYGSYEQQYLWNELDWEEHIERKILLEKILVQSIEISEASVEEAYNENKDNYSIEKTVHLSHILVEDKKSAQSIYEQLEDGADFTTLVLEHSIDNASIYQNGDIGYLNGEQTRYPSYFEQAAKLKEGSYSKPFKADDGYVIIYVHEVLKGKTYSFKEVKSMIERELALEELDGSISANYFWDELGVDWQY